MPRRSAPNGALAFDTLLGQLVDELAMIPMTTSGPIAPSAPQIAAAFPTRVVPPQVARWVLGGGVVLAGFALACALLVGPEGPPETAGAEVTPSVAAAMLPPEVFRPRSEMAMVSPPLTSTQPAESSTSEMKTPRAQRRAKSRAKPPKPKKRAVSTVVDPFA